MRTHRTYQVVAPWSCGTPVSDPDALVRVRLEPVMRQRRAALVLDLTLAAEDAHTVVPLVLVDLDVAVDRDRDPFVWPEGTPFDDAQARALMERVLPLVLERIADGTALAEEVVSFGAAPTFDAARAAGCYAAAPLRESLRRLGPYAFARRFARGRIVRIDAADADGGAALLRSLAAGIDVAPGASVAAARAWYGAPPQPQGSPDVAIVGPGAESGTAASIVRLDTPGGWGLTDPMPLDIGFSFDPAEGPPIRRWTVERAALPRTRASIVVRPAPVGGSAGRIVVALARADAEHRPGADTDEAAALAAALRAEGFDASICAGTADDLAAADLLHVIGTADGPRARALVDAGRERGIPVALHAFDEDAASGGWWGTAVARFCFEYGSDEADVAAYLKLLAARSVAVGGARGDAPFAPPQAADADAAIRNATVVFAADEQEAAALRTRTGRTGAVAIVAPLTGAVEAAAGALLGALTGPDPFVLAHAPIDPRHNQLVLARAAAMAGLPLVCAGPVGDAAYLERVREFGGPLLCILPEPDPAMAAALRAGAAVVADVAWIGDGASRSAAAVLAGARLVLAAARRLPAGGDVRRAAPEDAAGIAAALGSAWDAAMREPAGPAPDGLAAMLPAASFAGIIAGYAAAAPAT